ncbi:Clp1/GlmU family protein [Litchfieldella rifensis]|uniref:Clp1/GlmU family protein n=1 Tax=Litchfieldella rifensis TaxID=762643 RepID=A0ABV7LT33_9GAMM
MPPDDSRSPADDSLLALIRQHRHVLLAGAPGSGKTTLAAQVASTLEAEGRVCHCLGADPGMPGFGPPGAACLGVWRHGRWRVQRVEALCSLDAARFRLPLVDAVRRLAAACASGPLLVDTPGVVRGAAGAEMLLALAEAGRAKALVVLAPAGSSGPLAEECRALGLATLRLQPSPQAAHQGRLIRAHRRTAAWDAYLAAATEQILDLDTLAMIGTPPPRSVLDAWRGRQIGLLDAHGHSLAMGEVLAREGARLRVQAPLPAKPVHTLVVRDARRTGDGLLRTAPRHRPPTDASGPPPDLVSHLGPLGDREGPRPVIRLGVAAATLVNGVYGDPLLHLRLRHQRRSLMFDLGDPGRLPARIAHQVTDVFISHAHFDHIGGFLWLLRSRIGELPTCRVYGPPGLAHHLAGLVRGVLWDRVGDKAPRFEVAELHGDRLQRYGVIAGQEAPTALAPRPAGDGVLLQELGFRVRAVVLDHGTPVLAFAFEPGTQVNVRKERLAARGWSPGPWLGELKHRILAGEREASIPLPAGGSEKAGTLADDLLLLQTGRRLVYATDLADTPDNRRRLIALAQGAHTLICEAPFLQREADQAASTGHLTTRACGEIAAAAAVGQLVPFHFSRRHVSEPQTIYAEIRPLCPQVATPPDASPP